MKKILFLLFLLLLFSCTDKKELDYAIISGKIARAQSGTISILNNRSGKTWDTKLAAGGTFCDTLRNADGYYFIMMGKRSVAVFLKPGFDVRMAWNEQDPKTPITFTGKGAFENNYLVQKASVEEQIRKYEDIHYIGHLEENRFLTVSDSIYRLKLDLFKKNIRHFDKEFIFLEENALKYHKLIREALYETTRRMVMENNDFAVSDSFYPRLYTDIDLSDEALLKVQDYIPFVDSYIYRITKEELSKNDSMDFYVAFVEAISKKVTNEKIREQLAYRTGKYFMGRTNELEQLYGKIKPMLSDSNYQNELEKRYGQLKKIQKGAVSPSFELCDANGKQISLESLKGKLVYIDIWSPYCLPCMAELPLMKEVQKEYKGKNITFVGICVGETAERWQKLIKEKGMAGIQLIAPDERISFFSDYQVRGIPRYILIDTDGRIIDANAERPSSSKLKEQLDTYL